MRDDLILLLSGSNVLLYSTTGQTICCQTDEFTSKLAYLNGPVRRPLLCFYLVASGVASGTDLRACGSLKALAAHLVLQTFQWGMTTVCVVV